MHVPRGPNEGDSERSREGMGKLVFGMMQSFDGYVAGIAGGPELPPPGSALHRYFNDHVRGLAGSLYSTVLPLIPTR